MKLFSKILVIILFCITSANAGNGSVKNTTVINKQQQNIEVKNNNLNAKSSNIIIDESNNNNQEYLNISWNYTIPETVEKILPTVVSINALKSNEYDDYQYYGDNSINTQSLGSGFIISEDGYIITNNHVIDGAEKVNIKLKGSDTEFPAEIVGVDDIMDVALLKISVKTKLPYAEFEENSNQKVGDIVIVAGNPYNLGISVSTGIISALNRNLQMSSFDNFIQTDASINKGNSGGPMFNTIGKVIGLTSTIYSPDGENVGIGFAMPVNDLLPIIEELKKYGYVRRGWIGVTTENIQKEVYESLNSQIKRNGVIITDIVQNSPAEKAGLSIADIILTYNGKKIRNIRDFSHFISSTEIGSNIALGVFKDNKMNKVIVRIDETKQNYKYDPQYEALLSKAIEVFDMVLLPINKDLRKKFNISEENDGMYVLKTKKNGLADKKGIRTGDIILSINQDKATDGNVILENIHKAKLNNIKYVFLILKGAKNNLIFMPVKDNNLSNKVDS